MKTSETSSSYTDDSSTGIHVQTTSRCRRFLTTRALEMCSPDTCSRLLTGLALCVPHVHPAKCSSLCVSAACPTALVMCPLSVLLPQVSPPPATSVHHLTLVLGLFSVYPIGVSNSRLPLQNDWCMKGDTWCWEHDTQRDVTSHVVMLRCWA